MPRRAPRDPETAVARRFDDLNRRATNMEKPSGTQLKRTVEKVLQLIADLPGQIYAVLAVAVNTGTVNATGDVNTGGYLNSPAGSAFDITTGRTAAWWRLSDGRLAYASSSRSVKTNFRPSGIDPFAVLQIDDILYNYIVEVRKRDDPTFEEYVGPDYHVADEVGATAEQLHELGLWQFVQYQHNENDELVLVDGEPVPVSIHYTMLAIALLPVVRLHQSMLEDQAKEISDLRERMDRQGL